MPKNHPPSESLTSSIAQAEDRKVWYSNTAHADAIAQAMVDNLRRKT